ncbi:uncharacterized protein LOC119322763 [Triticum dicoccoides]|uniref:DUF6598 domain-containing protein n=2 Tax=Triticum TaxID=4564 RepID=A0A9R1B8R6_TRITD|nr:uncharacterized protein LOC119322763 [Triticum dicoccoides]XP_044411699.1 uncharacterized protein LOC123136409 [Triticum aestivum]VAI55640.1 unnamed protein product [Triticum turgidum subsp. durum]
MQSVSRSIIGLCAWPPALGRWRSCVGRVVSAPPRRWPIAREGRDASLLLSSSAHSNRHLDLLSSCNKEKQNKPHSYKPEGCATIKCLDTANTREKVTSVKKLTNEVTDSNPTKVADIFIPCIYSNSSHRDGAIYKNKLFTENWFDIDITDHNETRLEPMMFSKAIKKLYFPCNMLQFFSLMLAECSINHDPIELYGYIAVRDDRDGMRNYVLNYSRDDPIITQKGSSIQMTGPKRAIELVSPVLIEFDMRIKNGGQEEEDLQLIDGAISCHDRRSWKPVKHRIKGNCGAVDMSFACIEQAVEATIEVVISEVHSSFSLSLRSFVYVLEDYEETQLFHGSIDQSCGLRRFVLAVTHGDMMILKFRFGNSNVERRRSFKAELYGCSSRQIKHELANISVKVNWSTNSAF